MNARLAGGSYLAGAYSIADIACVGWLRLCARRDFELGAFANLRRWLDAVLTRAAVKRGIGIRVDAASAVDVQDPSVKAVLFGQRAR